jgi:hypothetical protein
MSTSITLVPLRYDGSRDWMERKAVLQDDRPADRHGCSCREKCDELYRQARRSANSVHGGTILSYTPPAASGCCLRTRSIEAQPKEPKAKPFGTDRLYGWADIGTERLGKHAFDPVQQFLFSDSESG